MGRPTKLTPELQAKAEKLIASGNYASTTCRLLGISESTWYDWLKRGKESKRKNRYSEFSDAIKRAEAAAEARAVSGIMAAGRKNWTAYAWYLERKSPDRWGRKDKLQQEISGPNGQPVEVEMEVDLSCLSDEELRTLVAIQQKLN